MQTVPYLLSYTSSPFSHERCCEIPQTWLQFTTFPPFFTLSQEHNFKDKNPYVNMHEIIYLLHIINSRHLSSPLIYQCFVSTFRLELEFLLNMIGMLLWNTCTSTILVSVPLQIYKIYAQEQLSCKSEILLTHSVKERKIPCMKLQGINENNIYNHILCNWWW